MNLEQIEFNNNDTIKKIPDTKLIIKALTTSDDYLIDKLNSQISTSYQAKINLIYYTLKNNLMQNTLNCIIDIKKFFNMISPLSIEFGLGSFKYSSKIDENYLFIHNSIPKEYVSSKFNKYIKLIKNNCDNLNYYYYELKNKRFNKTLDFIFVFKINGNNLEKSLNDKKM